MTATTASSITLNYTHTLDEQLHACRLYQRSTRKHLIYRGIGFLAIFGGVWIAITTGVNPQALLLLALGLFTWFDPVHLQETFSDVVKTDKTGLSKTAHTRWMISAFANFLPGSTIFRLA